MPHPISTLGAAHTLISLVPAAVGIYSFARYRGIDAATRSGRIYLGGLLLAVLTSFGLSSSGGFNAGHALGILALLSAGGALLISRGSSLPGAQSYLSQLGFSFSFFLMWIPGIAETLTRLPLSHPLADGPQSPLVRGALAAWFGVFVLGSAAQSLWIRSRSRAARLR
ncbi:MULTISPECIES: hypothetical protein [Achromobacter]|jgi:multisubunit Na+/H+ antiporter MnhG subunit|uniref:DUF2306 domain-containing protein n=1 Tax=Achromobacter denitrificans TaxID=32002 RepID=A0A6J5HW13_ACHDE|nr:MULTISPECIES: hypothetical protein [Achromobacter]ASC67959.1 hypothetical protein B9P52_28490 [Achromobacter denitrificans]QKQ47777.1 hypothetical protein FOC81_14200 [Achromobacter denitrificans]GFN26032.1 hypothetical protein ADE_17300 [Achromobacter denitrificans]CAB3857768.1 hypothetical protein LMG1860_03164 [Achromobacter denitrificans]